MPSPRTSRCPAWSTIQPRLYCSMFSGLIFDPRYRYLSEYAVGPYGALMTSTFFVLSAGSVALAIGLWQSVSSKLRILPGLLFWLTWACAVFLAGVFTGDLQGTPHTR